MSVLLVEDDETAVLTARAFLEELGCQVDVAVNGGEAVTLCLQTTYALILMDWQMPVMDGLEATARIRGMQRGRKTPIVGTTTQIGRDECLAAGMSDLMPKPFTLEHLKVVMFRWIYREESL
jgi:CheY-like chemotaxis protein